MTNRCAQNSLAKEYERLGDTLNIASEFSIVAAPLCAIGAVGVGALGHTGLTPYVMWTAIYLGANCFASYLAGQFAINRQSALEQPITDADWSLENERKKSRRYKRATKLLSFGFGGW